MSMEEALSAYDQLTAGQKRQKKLQTIRLLCQLDLFYLLTRVCGRSRHAQAMGL